MKTLAQSLGRAIGAGAQATIHEVLPAPGNRKQCAKVMGTASFRKRLGHDAGDAVLSDAELAALHTTTLAVKELQHRGIIAYSEIEFVPGDHLIVLMPQFGGSLEHWAHRHAKHVDEHTIVGIALQVCEALQFLHQRGIWHLDVSLRNCLVDDLRSLQPHCVLIDLETSTIAGRAPTDAFTEEMAAPERARAPSDKSDVWSTGMMLFALAAKHDFPGIVPDVPGLGAVSMNQVQITPTRVAAVVRRDLPNASQGLISLITMMLNHDPQTRPSMSAVVENLRALAAGDALGRGALAFPFTLGPLKLVPLEDADARLIHVYINSDMYDAHVRCLACQRNRSRSKQLRSDCATGAPHMPAHTSSSWEREPLLPGMDDALRMLDRRVRRSVPCWASRDGERSSVDTGVSGSANEGGHDPGDAGSASPSMSSSPPTRAAKPHAAMFLYPFSSHQHRSSDADSRLAASALLQIHGGFAVLATDTASGPTTMVQPAHCFAIAPAEWRQQCGSEGSAPAGATWLLHFTAAQPWPSCCTKRLLKDGRIHQDVPSLFGSSARCFCWLMPGESFSLPNGETWVAAPEGGFVFWFNTNAAEPHEMDRYFAVSAPIVGQSATHRAAGRGGSTANQLAEAVTRGAIQITDSFRSIGQVLVRGGSGARCARPRDGLAGDFGLRLVAASVPPSVVTLRRTPETFLYYISVSGDAGLCDAMFPITPDIRGALHPPECASYAVFLRPAGHSASQTKSWLTAHGGFAFLDDQHICQAVIALRLVPCTDDDRGLHRHQEHSTPLDRTFDLRLGGATLVPTLPQSATAPFSVFNVAAPAGETAAPASSQEGGGSAQPGHIPGSPSGGPGSDWDVVNSRGIQWMCFDPISVSLAIAGSSLSEWRLYRLLEIV